MDQHKDATSSKGVSDVPPAYNHEHSQSHAIGKSFASAHGHDHTGSQVAASAGPCGLSPMTQADDNSQA